MKNMENLILLAPSMQRVELAPKNAREGMVMMGVAILLGLTTYLMFFEPSYLTYKNSPFDVVKEPQPGEPVALRVVRCSSSSRTEVYDLVRDLLPIDVPPEADGSPAKPIILKIESVQVKPGCHDSTSFANVTPAGIRPGVWRLDACALTQGTWRRTCVPFASKPFRVKAKEAPTS